MRCAVISVCVLYFSALACDSRADDWPAFRGEIFSQQRGRAAGDKYPQEWSKEKNIAWRYPLPEAGNSSPVVVAGKVFITCPGDSGKERHTICLDRQTGNELWKQTVTYAARERTHNTNPACAATPAADEKHVVVWHGSAGVFCYDHDGNPLWKRELGLVNHIWGFGSSPILFEGMVFLNFGPGENSRLIALNVKNGETIWELPEADGSSGEPGPDGQKASWIGSWSTPQIAKIADQSQLICAQSTRLVACDPFDGKLLWYCTGLENLPRGNLVYSDPLLGQDFGAVFGGFNGPAIGFRLGGTGDVTEANRLWRESQRNPQRIGSGVIVGDHAYLANSSASLMQCVELQTGKVVWAERGPGTDHWGSVTLAGGLLYVTDQQGATHLFKPNPEKLEVVRSNEIGERSNATPAFSNGEIFLRTNAAVYCVRE